MTHADDQRAYVDRNRDDVNARRRASEGWKRPSQRPGRLASRFAHGSNRRAIALGIPGRLTATEVRTVVGPCQYCGGEATGWDHPTPMIRGGANDITNIVPCCSSCNRAKAHRTAEEFLSGTVVKRHWRSYRARVATTLQLERPTVRAAISDAYYEARNAGRTMEQAADDAFEAVVALFASESLESVA